MLSHVRFLLISWNGKPPNAHVSIYIGRLCPCELKMLTSESLDMRIHKLHVRLQLLVAKRPISGRGLVSLLDRALAPTEVQRFSRLARAAKK